MKVICGWCKEVGPEKAPFSDPRETHGICPACSRRVMAEVEKPPFLPAHREEVWA